MTLEQHSSFVNTLYEDLNYRVAALAGADANGVEHLADEYLAVAEMAGGDLVAELVRDGVDVLVAHHHADFVTDSLILFLRGCAIDWARRSFSYDLCACISRTLDTFSRCLTA